VAKISIGPNEIFVDANIKPPTAGGNGDAWTVTIDSLPRQPKVPREKQSATLYITKGELGRQLGKIDLGTLA
jgi:hypothetical protein